MEVEAKPSEDDSRGMRRLAGVGNVLQIAGTIMAVVATVAAFYLKSELNTARIEFHRYAQAGYETQESARLEHANIRDQLEHAQRERDALLRELKAVDERVRWLERRK